MVDGPADTVKRTRPPHERGLLRGSAPIYVFLWQLHTVALLVASLSSDFRMILSMKFFIGMTVITAMLVAWEHFKHA